MYCHYETMNDGTSLGILNIAPFFGGIEFFFHFPQRARFFYTKHCSPVAAGFFFTRTWLARNFFFKLPTNSSLFPQSLLTIGALLGGPIGGYLIEALGRKGAIMGASVPFLVGWMLIAFANRVSMLYIGRFTTGMGCGVMSLAVPVSAC